MEANVCFFRQFKENTKKTKKSAIIQISQPNIAYIYYIASISLAILSMYLSIYDDIYVQFDIFYFIYKSSTNLFLEVLDLVIDYFLPSWVWRGFHFFKFMLAAKVHVWFDLRDGDKIWHFNSLWFLSDGVWSKWDTETPRNFLSGNIECYLIIGYLFCNHVSEASHKYQHRPPTLKAEVKGQLRELVLAVFWSSCPPIGEISRHRHKRYQAVWACNSAVTLLNKEGYRRACYR